MDYKYAEKFCIIPLKLSDSILKPYSINSLHHVILQKFFLNNIKS